ncbi:sensor histidine kinase [Hymenobacter ruricola]|uniref:histidine kinase n=1 Tax=Hymenobacter ruricola TaxID=2791023 RepID=A0ABS0I6M3_9BACT|nr:tetratricopeptide repeat-containing sensor histidine kinase [Hymenobacter ruricola]MBF9222600.1 tetratricopeptide repeat-containing sensor histidine kinase [Hymenobacter ruricola]
MRTAWLLTLLLAALLPAPRPAGAQQLVARPLPDSLSVLKKRADDFVHRQQFDSRGLPLFVHLARSARREGRYGIASANRFYAAVSYLHLGRSDSAARWLRGSVADARRGNKPYWEIKAESRLLDVYTTLGLPDSTRAALARLQALQQRLPPETPGYITLYGALASYYQNEARYPESMRYRLLETAYHRQRRDTANLGVALSNTGEVLYLMGQYREALRYRFEGLRWVRLDASMAGTLPELHAMIAKTYTELHLLDSARYQYETSLRLLQANPDPYGAAYVHSELSGVLARQGRLPLARYHSRLALGVINREGDVGDRAKVNYYAGDLALRDHRPAQALAYLRRAYALARQIKNNDFLEPTSRALAQAEAANGHYAEAYRLRDLSARLLDSAHVASGQRAMAEMEARFQNRDKQQQIAALHRENQRRAAEAARERRATRQALAAAGALLLLLAAIGYLLRQRQRTAARLARQNAELATLNQRLNGSNAQLTEANQTKAKLFSIISHDLRAPVSNLFQLAELADTAPDLLDEATRRQQSGQIRQTARDLLDSMEELLAWSKDQLDRLDPVPEDVALLPALAEIQALYQPLAQRQQIALAVACDPGLHCHADPNFLRVVLRNLVQNAIKFTPAGGRVQLSAEAAGPAAVRLRIADTGAGLAAARLAQLLSDTAPPPTHGLGLRLTREFVQKLGGRLTAHSIPGQGTTFEVKLAVNKALR